MGEIGDRLRKAADLVRAEAARLATPWSEQIPPEVHVKVGAGTRNVTVDVISGVPPAYPNEAPRVRHPVFGNRRVWVTNPHRPFLVPAAEAKADDVAAEVARAIDDVAHKNGFEGTA